MNDLRDRLKRIPTRLLVCLATFWTVSPLCALDDSRPLNRYGRQTWQVESGLPQNTVRAISQEANGLLLLETDAGPVHFDGLRFIPTEQNNSSLNKASSERGTAVELRVGSGDRASGDLWTGDSNGLTYFRAGHAQHFTVADGLPSNRVLCLHEDRQRMIWVGTDQGLARISNGRIEKFAPNDSLASAIVLSLFEDREGDLWIGTESAGLLVLRDQKFSTLSSRDGLSNDLVRCVFEDRRGLIWIGTTAGLNRLDGDRISVLTTNDGLSSNVILSLAENQAGDLLVGTPDGLNVLREGRFRTLTSGDGLTDDLVRSLLADPNGTVWVGTRRGLSKWSGNSFQTFTQSNGLGSDLIGSMLRSPGGDLWVGTSGGLTRLKGRVFKNFTISDGLASNVITALCGDQSETLWIGTSDGGLQRLQNEKIFRYESRLGLPQGIYGILDDDRGYLWLTSKRGVLRVAKEALNALAEGKRAELSIAQFGTSDGLRVDECSEGGHPSAWKSADGRLWFATMNGLASLDPKQPILNATPPPIVIEAVTIDDSAFDANQSLDLPPGKERFAFEYAGLSFASPHKVKFRYRLEGFDKKWIDAGTRRVAYYTNLSPGVYRFHVSAQVNGSAWNENGASISFHLRPHFYQTYWFGVILLAVFACCCYATYRWRVRQVQTQFNAVLAERNRIAREIHDTLAQGFVAVSVQLEVVARMMAVSNEAAQELLMKTRELVRESLAEARRSIWQLRSQDRSNPDFASRLSAIATRSTDATGLNVNVQVGGTYRPLPKNVEDELLRIGQEALSNVVRHAGAKNVDIDLKYGTKRLLMTIKDDGKGFEPGGFGSVGPNGHFGLKGMRERAEQIGAHLSVISGLGRGTKICVETAIH